MATQLRLASSRGITIVDNNKSEQAPMLVPQPEPAPGIVPWWWRCVIIWTLRRRIPILWRLSYWPIRLLRSWSIQRALRSLEVGDVEIDCSVEFDYIEIFLRLESERRNDPEFQASCETAVREGRVQLFGLPVILDEEINDQGAGPILRHLQWTVLKTVPHPSPPEH